MTTHRPRYLTASLIAFCLALAILLAVLARPAHAAPAAYSCRWTVYNYTVPKSAVIRCSNGYNRAYVWSDRYNRWIPVATVDPAR